MPRSKWGTARSKSPQNRCEGIDQRMQRNIATSTKLGELG